MTNKNILQKLSCEIQICDNVCVNPFTKLDLLLKNFNTIYSYKVMLDKVRNVFICEILISQTDDFNCLTKETSIMSMVQKMSEYFLKFDSIELITFKQPPLKKLLEIYNPLIDKLCREQSLHWKIEFQDLQQICRMCICILYNKGYFIHKGLIRQTFINEVLKYVRSEIEKPEEISLDRLYDEQYSLLESIPDTTIQIEDDITNESDFEDKREKVRQALGVRQYDQLVRDYRNHNTGLDTTKVIKQLQRRFKKNGTQ